MLNKLKIGIFGKNVITLMTGTALAQAIPVLISPFLTRIYSPEQFGQFALYTSFITIFSIIITGRYDVAIMLPEDDEEAYNLLNLTIFIVTTVSALSFLLFIFLGTTNIIRQIADNIILFAIAPIQLFLIGIYSSFYHWYNRKGLFKIISIITFIQSISVAVLQIVFSKTAIKSSGLIFGSFFSQLIIFIFILLYSKVVFSELKNRFNLSSIKDTGIRYINFPKYDMAAGALNVGFQQIPVIMLNYLFNAAAAGYFSLTQRVLQIPVSLVGGSILGAFRQRAIEEQKQYGKCSYIFMKVLKLLITIAIIPSLIIIIFGSDIFTIIFGANWAKSGIFAQIMVITFFFRFITSPLTYTFYIAEKQKLNLYGQIIFIAATIISFIIGYFTGIDTYTIIFYSISNALIYLLYLVISYKFSTGNYNVIKR